MPIHDKPAELLGKLIRFDTTNPPGNEAECIHFLEGILREAGFETTILAKDSKRPNLVTRLEHSVLTDCLLDLLVQIVAATCLASQTFVPLYYQLAKQAQAAN